MAKPSDSIGKPHPEQTVDLWKEVGKGIHVRLRTRPCGEMLAIKFLIGATTDGPHRDAGQLILTPAEIAEFHRTFKGGCGLHGWRSDIEIIEE
jgi:hypothetical protein